MATGKPIAILFLKFFESAENFFTKKFFAFYSFTNTCSISQTYMRWKSFAA